jgi:hypothetical protein
MPQVLEAQANTTAQGIAIALIVLDGLLGSALFILFASLMLRQNKVNRRLIPLWSIICGLWALSL